MTDLSRSNQYSHVPVVEVENPLGYALTASLDPSISDRAVRLVAGLGPMLAMTAEAYPGKPAYVPIRTAESLTGLDLKTKPIDDLLAEVEQRIGVVRLVEAGRPNTVVRGHGLAARWALTQPVIKPSPIVLGRDAWHLLNPGDARWSRQHRAWRLCAALVATTGMGRASLATGDIARLLGCSKPNAVRVRKALVDALYWPASLRHIDLGDAVSGLSSDLGSSWDVGMRYLTHRQAWLDSHDDEVVETESEPEVVPEPEPMTDEERAYLHGLVARIRGAA